ncbi:hypothetical protein IQK56_22955 [Pseudomonas sp. MAFF 301449]|jgi:hypothetical protein|uniref:Uncharacterized protein n=1 Tax=Pseudomonas cyclaminis TaxID=2781239 RepID=A0ABR9SXB1_9PSED|nr:hypothetical protein [Pseudomonas cyclaminis]RMT91879.1 hypothetical protein ALP39_00185 [Pseudomonas marginalis pv. marginalis]VVM68651.1 hypothetical protein PS664_01671 [Pseudomonas fluorescens]MBE8593543.1 hypothetical protein [Pseudomonas cyclaminis]MBE8600946.1 hypothetical protein [Pseudomonas cyclaminis]VVN50520.1 hypothetical protein PS687_00314 [Pseudomonas fluorescens]
MTFQLLVLPDVRTLAAALRAKLCRAPAGFTPARPTFVAPSSQVYPARPLAHWRICPQSGQLVQQWEHADPQDPQRPKVSSLEQASLMLGLYVSARAA